MKRKSRMLAGAACVWAVIGCLGSARGGDVLAEISVRGKARSSALHGEMFMFPGDVRDYSSRSFYGWSFRQELGDDRVRVLEVARVRAPGAYLMATDLFADGHFSTMSHTVAMVFPRDSAEPYALREDASGILHLTAPNGAILRIDGHSGALLASNDFWLSPQGAPGTPPRLHHRGLRLEISSVGKSPFLRHTPARFVDASGTACTASTDELFVFGDKPESDVFRFDADAALFAFLAERCPRITIPAPRPRVAAVAGTPVLPGRSLPRGDASLDSSTRAEAAPGRAGAKGWPTVLDFLARLLSNR